VSHHLGINELVQLGEVIDGDDLFLDRLGQHSVAPDEAVKVGLSGGKT
jgi:hypothetical protein